ncbi:MAG: hypothetical protein ACM30E_07925 [Nitrososphaerales archaeon]
MTSSSVCTDSKIEDDQPDERGDERQLQASEEQGRALQGATHGGAAKNTAVTNKASPTTSIASRAPLRLWPTRA